MILEYLFIMWVFGFLLTALLKTDIIVKDFKDPFTPIWVNLGALVVLFFLWPIGLWNEFA